MVSFLPPLCLPFAPPFPPSHPVSTPSHCLLFSPFFFFLPVGPSVYTFVCRSDFLCVCLLACSVWPSFCLFACLFVRAFLLPSVCPFVCPFVCLSPSSLFLSLSPSCLSPSSLSLSHQAMGVTKVFFSLSLSLSLSLFFLLHALLKNA